MSIRKEGEHQRRRKETPVSWPQGPIELTVLSGNFGPKVPDSQGREEKYVNHKNVSVQKEIFLHSLFLLIIKSVT